MCSYYKDLLDEFPALKSIEDPFDEYDYEAWSIFMKEVIEVIFKSMVVGDDLYTTNTKTVKKGIENKWANSLLLKVNQIELLQKLLKRQN